MYHSLGLLIDDLAYLVVVLSCSLHLPSLAHIMNISKKRKKEKKKEKKDSTREKYQIVEKKCRINLNIFIK